jgi:hypothetical protein
MPFLSTANHIVPGNLITHTWHDEMGRELPAVFHLVLKTNEKTMWVVPCDKNGEFVRDTLRYMIPITGPNQYYFVSRRKGVDSTIVMMQAGAFGMAHTRKGGKFLRGGGPKPVFNTDLNGPLPDHARFAERFADLIAIFDNKGRYE